MNIDGKKKYFGDFVEFLKTNVKTLLLNGTEVTATAAELNILDGQAAGATITVGAETTNVINVTIQLLDANGADLAKKAGVKMFLTSDDTGNALEAAGPDSWEVGTDGILIPDGDDSVISGLLISEADGDIDLNLTHSGADTFYLNLVMPNGDIVTSDAITFDAVA